MNRKEQISDTAEHFYLNNEQNNYDDERLSKAFIRGAEWADANPYINEVKNFDYQKEWDDHDYDAIEMHLPPKAAYQFGCDDMKQKALDSFCNVKCGTHRPCEQFDYKNHLCEDFCIFEKLLKA